MLNLPKFINAFPKNPTNDSKKYANTISWLREFKSM